MRIHYLRCNYTTLVHVGTHSYLDELVCAHNDTSGRVGDPVRLEVPSSGLAAGVVGGVFLSLVVLVSKLVVDYIYHICVGGGAGILCGGGGVYLRSI